MNRLVIIGAGGHGKVIADNALKNGYTDISFVDDCAQGSCMGFPIVGTSADVEQMNDGKTDFVVGIGDNKTRRTIVEGHDLNWVTLVHPSAQIAADATIGRGTVVMAGAVANACVKIGSHCIINTNAIVEHDNAIGDFVQIAPGVILGGTVRIGEQAHIGIGATVSNNINVCENCVIGAGAVVIKDIEESGTYVGVPAQKIK